MNIEVDYVALLAAGVASMVVGFVWYGALFAKPWTKLMGWTEEKIKADQAKMGQTYGISFVVALITAFVLSHVMTMSATYFAAENYTLLQTGLMSAFWMWLGFIMPVQITDWLFGGRKFQLFLINTGYQLVSVLAMGVVLASL